MKCENPTCGREFTPAYTPFSLRSTAKYCSLGCKEAVRREQMRKCSENFRAKAKGAGA